MSKPGRVITDQGKITRLTRDPAPDMATMRRPAQQGKQAMEGGWHIDDPTQTNMFPHYTYPRDVEADTRFRTKHEILAQRRDLGYTHELSEEDIAYFERKQEVEEGVAFRQWITTKFDLKNPAIADMVNNIFPEIWTDQEEFIKQRFENAYQWCLLNVRAPRSRRDFEFIWQVDEGRITIPQGFTPATIGLPMPAPFGTQVETGFSWGPFNPMRWVTSDIDPSAPGYNTDNPQNITAGRSARTQNPGYNVRPNANGAYGNNGAGNSLFGAPDNAARFLNPMDPLPPRPTRAQQNARNPWFR